MRLLSREARDLLHDVDADLTDLPTGIPAAARVGTPEPAPSSRTAEPAALEAPEPTLPDTPRPPRGRPIWLREGGEVVSGIEHDEPIEGESAASLSTLPPLSPERQETPTLRRVIPEDYAGPARVRVPQPAEVQEEEEIEVAASTGPHPAELLVPDQQRIVWVLDQLLEIATEIRAFVSWIRPLGDYLARGVELVERIDQRDATRLRESNAERAAETAAIASKPTWQRILDHRAARPALGLLTWLWGGLSGALVVGALDYLGAETEPVTKFLLAWLGVVF